jgi:hypothetical protein
MNHGARRGKEPFACSAPVYYRKLTFKLPGFRAIRHLHGRKGKGQRITHQAARISELEPWSLRLLASTYGVHDAGVTVNVNTILRAFHYTRPRNAAWPT